MEANKQTDWLLIQAKRLRKQAEETIETAEQIERTVRVMLGEEESANTQETSKSELLTEVLKLAEEEIGTKEDSGNNDGERIRYYQENLNHLKNQPWCASFVSRMILDACKNLSIERLFSHTAGAVGFYHLAKKLNWKITNIPEPGAIFILGMNTAKNYATHTGFVKKALSDKEYTTIEGNCGNAVKSITRKTADTSCFVVIQ